MRTIVENLLALQDLLLAATAEAPADPREVARRRQLLPAPVLVHFDRMIARGKRSAAVVRHGVCGECHLRVPTGTLVSLAAPHDLQMCDSCGCFLLLAEGERPSSRSPLPVQRRPAPGPAGSAPVS